MSTEITMKLTEFTNLMNYGNDTVLNLNDYNICVRYNKGLNLNNDFEDFLTQRTHTWNKKKQEFGIEPFYRMHESYATADGPIENMLEGVIQFGRINPHGDGNVNPIEKKE